VGEATTKKGKKKCQTNNSCTRTHVRIKQNRLQKEREEVELRRNMTDAERRADDLKHGKNLPKEKNQMRFMQKYYHKGVFYQDDDKVAELMSQDFNQPTLEDRFDKSSLPSVMQVSLCFCVYDIRTLFTSLLSQFSHCSPINQSPITIDIAVCLLFISIYFSFFFVFLFLVHTHAMTTLAKPTMFIPLAFFDLFFFFCVILFYLVIVF
jgi:hypothetical protein